MNSLCGGRLRDQFRFNLPSYNSLISTNRFMWWKMINVETVEETKTWKLKHWLNFFSNCKLLQLCYDLNVLFGLEVFLKYQKKKKLPLFQDFHEILFQGLKCLITRLVSWCRYSNDWNDIKINSRYYMSRSFQQNPHKVN